MIASHTDHAMIVSHTDHAMIPHNPNFTMLSQSLRLTFVSGLSSGSRACRGAIDRREGLEDEAMEVLFSGERGQSPLSRAAASDITEWLWASSGFEPFKCRSGRRRWATAASAVRLLIESFL